MSADTTEVDEPTVLVEIREQHEKIRHIRDVILPGETRRLAEMIAATREDPDPRVHPTAASRAMGTAKDYAHQLVRKLDAGKL